MHERYIRLENPCDRSSASAILADIVLTNPPGEYGVVLEDDRGTTAFSVALEQRFVQIVDMSGHSGTNGIFSAQVVNGSRSAVSKALRTVPEAIPPEVYEAFLHSDGALLQTIRTKHNGAYITPMRANALFESCWRYFTTIYDLNIGVIPAMWYREGDMTDNFRMFEEAQRTIHEHDPDLPGYYIERLAALETWTGRQAARVGFEEVRVVEHESKVLAYFFQ